MDQCGQAARHERLELHAWLVHVRVLHCFHDVVAGIAEGPEPGHHRDGTLNDDTPLLRIQLGMDVLKRLDQFSDLFEHVLLEINQLLDRRVLL